MKLEKKILFAASCLIVSSLSGAAISTLAWFETTRSATLSLTSISIEKNAGQLEGRIYPYSRGTVDLGGTTLSSSTSYASDVSSKDGIHFYRPYWLDSAASKASSILDVTGDYSNYSDFLISLGNTGNAPIRVFLSEDSAIVPAGNASSNAFATYSRVWLNAIDPADIHNVQSEEVEAGIHAFFFERKMGISPYEKTALDQYVDSSCIDGEGLVTPKTLPDSLTRFYQEDLEPVSSSTSPSHPQYLFSLLPNQTRYFYGSVCLEGTAGDSDPAYGGSVEIRLSFQATDE